MSGSPEGARVEIRPAQFADLRRIQEIERASYSSPWEPEAFRSLLGRKGVTFLVATTYERTAVGHAILWRVDAEAELANLAVEPRFRRRGIGAALLERALEEAGNAGVTSVFLEVRASNQVAIDLYSDRGFRQIAVREQYYSRPPEDALILRLELSKDATSPRGGASE